MRKLQKKWYIGVGLFAFAMVSLSIALAQTFGTKMIENEFIKKLKASLAEYQKERPAERLYLHIDKPFYKPGETIWFTAYLRNEIDLKSSTPSKLVRVELLDPKGGKIKEIVLYAKNGAAPGDFTLDAEAPGGLYKIKGYTRYQTNAPEAFIFEKDIQVQAVALPRVLMKLDFERKAFGPGELVVAKFNLRSLENKPISNFAFKYIANLGGATYLTKNANTDETGTAYIKFDLPKDLKTPDGLLNVLVSYEGENESISRAIPIVLNKINLTLYPEGGELITGLESKVAFAALNEFGKPADIAGVVIDDSGAELTQFESYHQGMGAFKFKPQGTKKYKVRLTKPAVAEFDIPDALPRGYGLNIEKGAVNRVKATILSTEVETLSLVGQVRGQIYYASAVPCQPGTTVVEIVTDEFPAGVAQFTLFDAKGIERAERLTFVNKFKQLKIDIKTNKEQYQPREKVELTLKVTDERGVPVPGNFSLAVTDDKLLSFADDKTGNILSQLLLEQDIKGKVEEAKLYFDPNEAKADLALDYLLMTRGWRRFTWKQVQDKEYYAIQNPAEKGTIYGKSLKDPYTGKLLANTKLVLATPKGERVYNTDANGNYEITDYAELHEPTNLNIQTEKGGNISVRVAGYGEMSRHNMEILKREMEVEALGGAEEADDANAVDVVVANRMPQRAVRAEAMAPMMEQKVVRGGGMENQRGGPGRAVKGAVEPAAPAEDAPAPVVNNKNIVAGNAEKPAPVVIDNRMAGAPPPVAADKRKLEAERKKERLDNFMGNDDMRFDANKPVLVYRAREFAAPTYTQPAETRTDFRSTIYWKGDIALDRTGKTTLSFYNSDEVTAFRVTVEGVSVDGTVGRGEYVYSTILPFSMSVKPPVEVAMGDKVMLPLVLKNNTAQVIKGTLEIAVPKAWKPVGFVGNSIELVPNAAKTIYLEYDILNEPSVGKFNISFASKWAKDAFEQEVKVAPRGFPSRYALSGSELEKSFEVEITDLVPGTLEGTLVAYPTALSEMVKGLENLLREPYGCFEQTSSTAYPNIMVMQYLKENEVKDLALLSKAEKLLASGYKKLTAFETKEKGYEWFGHNPPHEALTAYGLLEFKDMQTVYNDVDNAMVDRTAQWLLSRRDGKGGFLRDPKALDAFGGASPEITNAYIFYSLAEAGYTNLDKEADACYQDAVKSGDPYRLGLVANALFMLKDNKRGNELLNKLVEKQKPDGGWEGLTHSITRSGGVALRLETTSLAILALLKNPGNYAKNLNDAIKFLYNNRTGFGGYGSTQSTILCLKALTAYTKYSKRTQEGGEIEVYVNGKKVATQKYEAGNDKPIELAGLGEHLKAGKHTIKVKYSNGVKNPLPYNLSIGWSTYKPLSAPECKLKLETKLAQPKAKVGETVRLTTRLINSTDEGLPMSLAVVGLPGGLSPQPWQLKELQEKKVFDFYEVIGSNVVFYYRQMAPKETREIALDLKAELPGEFEAPASSAYLYYTNEHKFWSSAEKVQILKP